MLLLHIPCGFPAVCGLFQCLTSQCAAEYPRMACHCDCCCSVVLLLCCTCTYLDDTPIQQPVVRFNLPTANSVLLSALEWGEVMVVKDTVTYFGRNAGGGAVRDLFLPDRQMVGCHLVISNVLYGAGSCSRRSLAHG